jgi:hypothetical protein
VNSLNKLALAAAATAALAAAAAPAAYAGSAMNGPRLTGIVLEALEAHRPVVTAVRLPSGDDGASPDGLGPDGAEIVVGAKPRTPDGDPKRGAGLVVLVSGGSKPDTSGGPK